MHATRVHTAEIHDLAYAKLVPPSIVPFMYLSPLACLLYRPTLSRIHHIHSPAKVL